MPDVLVRNIEESVLDKLKERAKNNGRSLQTELKLMIGSFVSTTSVADAETANRIKDGLRGRAFLNSVSDLRDDRQR